MFSPKKQTWPSASGAFFLARPPNAISPAPVFRFAGAAAGEARNFTSAAAASPAAAALASPAEIAVVSWMSAGSGPSSVTPSTFSHSDSDADPGFGHVDTAAGNQQTVPGQIIDPGRRRNHDVERLAGAEPPDDLVGPGPDRDHLVPARFLECRRQFAESRLERAGADDLDLGGIRDGDHRRARDAECGQQTFSTTCVERISEKSRTFLLRFRPETEDVRACPMQPETMALGAGGGA
jgi:hypothetical protein